MSLEVIPLSSEKMTGKFDVFESLLDILKKNHTNLMDGDIIVISTKYVSNSQGRIVILDKVRVSNGGIKLSKEFKINPSLAEIVLRESEKIFGGISGFIITSADCIMAPNAGIDKSNASMGKIILYPKDPFLIAERIRRKIYLRLLIHVGIILVDSRLMPARIGTSGITVACAGLEPVLDMRAKKDLEGNPLKVTFQAVADNIAAIANYKMGEGSESKPFVVVRNSGVKLTDRKINMNELAISPDQCVYVRGLSSHIPK